MHYSMDWLPAQSLVVLALLGTSGLYAYNLSSRKHLPSPERKYLDQEAFTAAVKALGKDCKAAEVFSKSACDLYKAYNDDRASLDGKIGTLLGFVSGGTGIFAVLSESDKIAKPTWTPLLGLVILSLIGVFISAFEGLRPRIWKTPDVAAISDPTLMNLPNGEAQSNAIIGWQHLEAVRNVVPIVLEKAKWLRRCYAAFALGTIALVVNGFFPAPSANSGGDRIVVWQQCSKFFAGTTDSCTMQFSREKK